MDTNKNYNEQVDEILNEIEKIIPFTYKDLLSKARSENRYRLVVEIMDLFLNENKIFNIKIRNKLKDVAISLKLADYCKICGFTNYPPAWGEDGYSPTDTYCACCGVEFGYGDSNDTSIDQYRIKWLKDGAKWSEESFKPKNWDIYKQLENTNFDKSNDTYPSDVENIKNKDDFVRFLAMLSVDFEANSDQWESNNIGQYLEAMSAWIESTDMLKENENIWKTMATIFLASKTYE